MSFIGTDIYKTYCHWHKLNNNAHDFTNPLQQVNNGGFDFKTITEDKIEISTRIANNYKNDKGILGILVFIQ